MIVLLAALGGGAGAVARFVVDALLARHTPIRAPFGTFTINVTGSLALGLLTGLAAAGTLGPGALAVLGTGFCGGYTTFSTASVETVRLLVAEGRGRAAGYAALTLVTCVVAALVGIWIGSWVGS